MPIETSSRAPQIDQKQKYRKRMQLADLDTHIERDIICDKAFIRNGKFLQFCRQPKTVNQTKG